MSSGSSFLVRIASTSRSWISSIPCTCGATSRPSFRPKHRNTFLALNELPRRVSLTNCTERPSPISLQQFRHSSSSSKSPRPHPTPTHELDNIQKQTSTSSLFFPWSSSSKITPEPIVETEDPLRELREKEMEKILLRRRMRRDTGGFGGSSTGGFGGFGLGGNALDVRCTTLDEKGVVTTTAGQYDKLQLCSRYGIPPRDLRKLDSGVPTVVPTILVRRSAIILTILHLRVVITAKEVTLFDSVGTEDSHLKSVFVWDLEYALKNAPSSSSSTLKSGHSSLPYEFRALETCLISVTTALDTELHNIRALVGDLLSALEEHIDRDNLRLLLQYSRKLADFQKRATLVMQCLDEVLENDDDLAAMYLTEKVRDTPRTSEDHEEVELLLESFSKQCEEIVSAVEMLSANVRSTEDIIELILDANRNSLLGLDLRVSIATMGLTSGALIAGFFGMNLQTNFETHPFAFPAVTAMALAIAIAVTAGGLRTLRRMRRVGLGWRAGVETGKGVLSKRGEAVEKWGDKWAGSKKRSKLRRY